MLGLVERKRGLEMDKITLVAALTDYEETYYVRNVDRSENFNCQEELRGEENEFCNCKHNSNSRDNEPCCRCDSKVSENDDTKNKVTSLEIIVRMIDNKPYYEIKYKKVGEYYYHIGYSSFNIDNVLKFRDECFEIVDVKVTNAERIRNMTDDELAEFLAYNAYCEGCYVKKDDSCCYPDGTCKQKHLEWLQSEA